MAGVALVIEGELLERAVPDVEFVEFVFQLPGRITSRAGHRRHVIDICGSRILGHALIIRPTYFEPSFRCATPRSDNPPSSLETDVVLHPGNDSVL